MALAEKYGLKVELEDEYSGEVLPTIQEIEKYFQFMSKVISQKYQLCLVKEGEVAVMPSPLFTRSTSASEGGAWNGRGSYNGHYLDFHLTWDSRDGKASMTIKPSADEYSFTSADIISFHYMWVGDGGLSFSFDAIARGGIVMKFSGTGHVSTKTGMGDLSLSPRW